MDVTNNPWVFDTEGDTSHLVFPGQRIFVRWIVVYGGTATGNIMLLDDNGTFTQVDPRIVWEGSISADSRTEVLVDHYVRGLFLDDIPAGGKALVYHGRTN